MAFRCPACHRVSDQRGHFVAHMKPRRYNCKGWDLLTDTEKDPDSNGITQQEYEEALAAAKAQKRKQKEEVEAKPSAQASAALSHPPRICFKDVEICGSKEETEFLLTDRKRHAQTLLSLLASSPGVTGCHQLWQLARSCRVTSCSLQWCGCAALLRCGDLGLSVMLCFFALRLMPALQHSLLACITCLTFLPDTLHQGQVPPSTTKVVEFFCFFFLPVNRSVILESATPSRVSTLCSLVLHYECPNTFSGVSAVRPARSPQRPPSMGCNASTLIKAQPHLHVTCSCSNQEMIALLLEAPGNITWSQPATWAGTAVSISKQVPATKPSSLVHALKSLFREQQGTRPQVYLRAQSSTTQVDAQPPFSSLAARPQAPSLDRLPTSAPAWIPCPQPLEASEIEPESPVVHSSGWQGSGVSRHTEQINSPLFEDTSVGGIVAQTPQEPTSPDTQAAAPALLSNEASSVTNDAASPASPALLIRQPEELGTVSVTPTLFIRPRGWCQQTLQSAGHTSSGFLRSARHRPVNPSSLRRSPVRLTQSTPASPRGRDAAVCTELDHFWEYEDLDALLGPLPSLALHSSDDEVALYDIPEPEQFEDQHSLLQPRLALPWPFSHNEDTLCNIPEPEQFEDQHSLLQPPLALPWPSSHDENALCNIPEPAQAAGEYQPSSSSSSASSSSSTSSSSADRLALAVVSAGPSPVQVPLAHNAAALTVLALPAPPSPSAAERDLSLSAALTIGPCAPVDALYNDLDLSWEHQDSEEPAEDFDLDALLQTPSGLALPYSDDEAEASDDSDPEQDLKATTETTESYGLLQPPPGLALPYSDDEDEASDDSDPEQDSEATAETTESYGLLQPPPGLALPYSDDEEEASDDSDPEQDLEAAAETTESHDLLQTPSGLALPYSDDEDEASDDSDDDSAYAEFLAGLKASSTPLAATRGTRLPELPPLDSSPVLGAPAPCLTQGLVAAPKYDPCSSSWFNSSASAGDRPDRIAQALMTTDEHALNP